MGDVIGERISLILASFFATISTILFLQPNVYFIFLAEILLAISSTFMSGSFESLLYKYCSVPEYEIDCERFVSRAYSLQWVALCVSFLGCFFFMKFVDLKKLFWLTFVFNLLSVIIAFRLPNIFKKSKRKPKLLISDCLRQIGIEKNIKIIFFYNLFMKTILISGYQIFQPYLTELKYDSTFNGVIYFIGAFIASMGSEIFGKLSAKKSYKWIFVLCSIMLIISMFGFSISYKNIIISTILLCLYRFAWGLSTPLLVLLSNGQLKNDDFRNTFFSIISLSSNLLVGIVLFIFATTKINVSFSYGVLGIIATVFLIFVYFSWVKVPIDLELEES